MLSDYIEAYIEAKKNNNVKQMERIEKQLAKLGMDKHSLDVVVAELSKGERQ